MFQNLNRTEVSIPTTRADIQFTRAELSALEWAIPILEEYAQQEFKKYKLDEESN